jgi:hypothetical protein
MLLFLILLLFSPFNVYADGFDISGDGALNEYYQATAFSISEYPANSNIENSISYDGNDLVGINTNLAIQEYLISSLTSLWYMKRVPNILDRVSGPPGTKIDILYFYLNDTGHLVDISKIVVPFSRNIPDMGNLNNLVEHLDFTPVFSSIDVSFDNRVVRKEGVLKEYKGIGVVGTDANGLQILDTVVISDPIEVTDIQIFKNGEILDIAIKIRNKGNEKLNNISFEHNMFAKEFTLNAFEEILLEYTIPYSEDLGSYKINNPNIKTECAIYGSNNYNWFGSNAVTVLAYREDGGWINGAHVQPSCESFCITRLPYTVTSVALRYEKESQDDILKEELEEELEVVSNDFEEEILGEVLGIQNSKDFVLPKTAKLTY